MLYIHSSSLSPDELEDFKYRNALDPDEVEIDNLVDLPILNEPEILFCLKNRFFKDHVYTQTGKILIAINPLREIAKQPYNEKMLFKFAHDVCIYTAPNCMHVVSMKSYQCRRLIYLQKSYSTHCTCQ